LQEALPACSISPPVLIVRGDDERLKPDVVKEKLPGTWEGKETSLFTGQVWAFTKDGKVITTVTMKRGNRENKQEGTWRIDGGVVKVTLKGSSGRVKGVTSEWTITQLDDQELVVEEGRGRFSFTLQRAAAAKPGKKGD
jgi:uncharacterized protein (TIGR03066 family)